MYVNGVLEAQRKRVPRGAPSMRRAKAEAILRAEDAIEAGGSGP